MKKRISQLQTLIIGQFPPVLLVLTGIMKEWLPWLLCMFFSVIGIVVWWKYRNRRWGITLVTIAAFCGAIGIYMNNHKNSQLDEIQQAHDPLRSFVVMDDAAERAWDSNDVALLEAVATYTLYRNMDKNNNNSFNYFDNIWKKLENSKRAGSPSAGFNMAIMCAKGYGRPVSIDDAVENLQKAISLDSTFVPAYLMLEELKLDSVKFAETYSIVKNWRAERNIRDSIAIEALSELDNLFGVIDLSNYEESKHDSVMNSIMDNRFQCFNDNFNNNKESNYWKVVHDNKWALRDAVAMDHPSYATLLLGAYYHGINEADSALFYYEKFLSSDMISRMHTNVFSSLYTFIPDTIVNIFTRDIKPLLIGLSLTDLYYLADSSGDIKLTGERINHLLAEVAVCVKNLKGNRTLVHTENAIAYKSKFNELAQKFAVGINNIFAEKSTIIGYTKSKKYNNYYFVDIYNERKLDINDLSSKKSCGVVFAEIPQKSDITILFFNGDERFGNNNIEEMQYDPKLCGARIRLQNYFKRNNLYNNSN